MTPIEIAYFKHFMFDRGLARTFQYLYRTRRIKGGPNGDTEGNPEKIEQFLLQTSREDVILKAFVFQMSNGITREDHSFDYWKSIDEKWQTYMRDNDDNNLNDSWPQLRNTFSILRQNWDAERYWKRDNFESTSEVYERMNINLPLPEKTWEHGAGPIKRGDEELLQLNIHNASDGDILVRVKTSANGEKIRTIMLFRKLEPFNDEPGHILAKLHAFYCINNKQFRVSGEDYGNIIVNENDPTVNFRGAFEQEKDLIFKQIAGVGLKWDAEIKGLIPINKEPEEDVPVKEDDNLIEFADEEENNDIDIEFFDISNNRRRISNGLQKGILSINTRNKSSRITINRIDSKDILKRNVGYARIGKQKNGDVILMFCNYNQGTPIVYNSDNYYNINSTPFVETANRLLENYNDLAYIRMEKVSEKIDSITYKLTKQ